MTKQYLLSLVLAASLIWNVMPAAGQTSAREKGIAAVTDIQFQSDPIETFAGLQRSGRDELFAQSLDKITGDRGDASDALDAQGAYFYERFRSGLGDMLGQITDKGREANRIAYEKRKGAVSRTTRSAPAPKQERSKRVYGKSSGNYLRELAAGSLFADGDLTINKFETPTSTGATAEDIKTIDSPEATVTNTQSGNTKLSYDEKEMSVTTSTTSTQKAEAVSKADNRKASKVTTIEWSTTFGWCPDAEGKVRGKAKARIFNQSTVNTGTQLAAATTEYLLEFNITAFVNDDAEMTHFDMEGVVSEKIVGLDRAVRLGLVVEKPGFKDGSASIVINIDNSKPPVDQPSGTRDTDITLGTVSAKVFGIETAAQNDRLNEFLKWGFGISLLELNSLMKISISRWQNGECVDVECTAPKSSLKPNEMIDVTAVSISKQDLGKFNAKLNGTGTESVTPSDQDGTPQAVYTLTAPRSEEGRIIVRSTSRRGIGSGMLTFGVEKTIRDGGVRPPKNPPVKTPPVKQPPCDGGWTGTVKAVRTKVVNKETGQDGRLVRQVDSKREVYDVKVTVLGTRDTSGGILNNYNANAEASIMSTVYRESNYAPGKMSCDKSIITSPQTHKMEIQEKGELNEKILVAIAINGNRGSIDFSGPGVPAERIITRIYESNCPSYDAVNSSVDRGSGLIERPNVGFEIYFLMDPASPNVMKGSQTVQNSDGSETMFTWDLSRCK